jgi:hypothetical protein
MDYKEHPELIKFIKTYVFWMAAVGVLATVAFYFIT